MLPEVIVLSDFVKGVLSAVISGLIVLVITLLINAPRHQTIDANLNWFRFPNPTYSSDYEKSRLVSELFGNHPELGFASAFFNKFHNNNSLFLTNLEIHNPENSRSGAIEVNFPGVSAFYDGQYHIFESEGIIKLGNLDPGETKSISFLSYYSSNPLKDLLILNGGEKIYAVSGRTDSYIDVFGMSSFMRSYPMISMYFITFPWILILTFFVRNLLQKHVAFVQSNNQERSGNEPSGGMPANTANPDGSTHDTECLKPE